MTPNDHDIDFITLDQYVVERKEASYVVRMPDRSLEERGIYAGDIVVVERGKKAKRGDLVFIRSYDTTCIINIDDCNNESYPDAVVEAVVVGLVRKY